MTRKLTRSAQAGFTLIELLVVMVILGLLFGIVGPRIFGEGEKARRTTARVQIATLEDSLHQFQVDNGFYPSTEQGLEALVAVPSVGRGANNWREGGYLEKNFVPKDPWGNPYIYLSPGNHGDFDLLSYGADGEPGGEGDFADITNWESE